jgi:hypothetical protein
VVKSIAEKRLIEAEAKEVEESPGYNARASRVLI